MENYPGIYGQTMARFRDADQLIGAIKERYDRIHLEFPLALEIGCKMGYITELLATSLKINKLYAIDADSGMLTMAKVSYPTLKNVEFAEEDFSKPVQEMVHLKSLAGKMSFIFSDDYLGTVTDKHLAATNIATLAAKHADIYLVFYAPIPLQVGWLAKYIKINTTHEEFVEWKNEFVGAGLRIVDSKVIDYVEVVDERTFQSTMIPLLTAQIKSKVGIWFDFLSKYFYRYLSGIRVYDRRQRTYRFPREKFFFRLAK